MEVSAMSSEIMQAIDPEELINLTAELVGTNSVWDPEGGTSEQAVAEKVARWAAEQGFAVEMNQVAPGRPNVVLRWAAGPGNRTLMFEGHTDVVTPGDPAGWCYDPFAAVIKGRRMYGRGANDTKGNLAAMLVAMAALKRSGVKLAGRVLGGVLCDEEDAMLGVLDFIERGHADHVTGAVICEPQDGFICTSQKGALRARYSVTGKMSHGAMPLAGLNTAPAVARLIDGLHQLELDAVTRPGRDKHLGWPSFTPTVIKAPWAGPSQLNVMPGGAEILVDVRTVAGQSHPAIRDEMLELAQKVMRYVQQHYAEYDRRLKLERDHSLAVEVDFLTDRPCTSTDPADPLVRAAHWATGRITKTEPQYSGVQGATDGTFLWSLKNIPIVTMGAGARHVAHQMDEWVDLDQLVETAGIYALTALWYLKPGNAV